MDKIGLVWVMLAIVYIVYTVIFAKHGFMFFNTSITIAMILIGGYYLIKK